MPLLVSPNRIPLPEEIPGVLTPFDEFIIKRNLEVYRQLGHAVFELDSDFRSGGHTPGESIPLAQFDKPLFSVTSWNFIVGDDDIALPRLIKTEFQDGPPQPVLPSTMFFVENYKYPSAFQAWAVKFQQLPEGSMLLSQKPISRRLSHSILQLLNLATDQLAESKSN